MTTNPNTQGTVDTQIGQLTIVAVDARNAYVRGDEIVIRGVPMSASFHLECDITWTLHERTDRAPTIHTSISWAGGRKDAFQSATRPAIEKIREIAVPAAIEWANDNPKAFLLAEIKSAKMEMERTDRERAEAWAVYDAAREAHEVAVTRHTHANVSAFHGGAWEEVTV